MPSKEFFVECSKNIIRFTPVLILLYDLIAFKCYGREVTISHRMWVWSLMYWWFAPWVTIGVIFLLFHFFWNPNKNDIPK